MFHQRNIQVQDHQVSMHQHRQVHFESENMCNEPSRSVNLNTFSMGTLEREERIAGPDNSGSLRVTPNKMEKSNYPPASKSRKKHIDHWR